MSEESILQEADRIINGERRESYGGVLESFDRIARLWEPVLGVEVSAEQVGLCLIQLKVARYLHGQQRDSIVDIAGYAGCLEKMAQDRAVLEIEDRDDFVPENTDVFSLDDAGVVHLEDS